MSPEAGFGNAPVFKVCKDNWNALAVNTDCAFEAWGLNINDLERRYIKLRKYGMVNYEKPNNRRNAQEEGTVQGMSAQTAALPHMV